MKLREFALLIGALSIAPGQAALAQNPTDRPLPSPTTAAKPKPYAPAPAADRKLQPLPEPPPPPPGFELDASLEPQITIQRRDGQTIEEHRVRGRLYMVKVTPEHGVPYYLIDQDGKGDFTRRDNLDTGTRPPMWVIHTF
jgi:hypothetical protein